jgi:DNA repair protein RadA/Sms
VRAVGQVELRVREAMKLGFTRCIVPESSRAQLPRFDGVDLVGAATLAQVWDLLF